MDAFMVNYTITIGIFFQNNNVALEKALVLRLALKS